MKMGKFSRDKGYRTENNIRKKADIHGLYAYRVPLSGGASHTPIKGDVIVSARKGADEWVMEIKCRADGFKNLYKWKGDHDALVIKADNKSELAIIDLDDFFELLSNQK